MSINLHIIDRSLEKIIVLLHCKCILKFSFERSSEKSQEDTFENQDWVLNQSCKEIKPSQACAL